MPAIKQLIEAADIVDLKARTKDEALRELVEVLSAHPQITDPKDFLKRILERERVISTGIGIGLAMPHVKIPSVTDFVLAIGRSSRGIEFDSLDGHPVHIVAMIGASDQQSGEFLKVLAKLVLKLKDKALRQQILLAPTIDDVRHLLIADEE